MNLTLTRTDFDMSYNVIYLSPLPWMVCVTKNRTQLSDFQFQKFIWTSLVTQLGQTWVWSLDWEDPLEKGKVAHSSILAWRIPWTVQSIGSQRVWLDWVTLTFNWSRSTWILFLCYLSEVSFIYFIFLIMECLYLLIQFMPLFTTWVFNKIEWVICLNWQSNY